MDDVLDILLGVDKKREIFNLWYEITYLRGVLNEMMSQNPSLHINLTAETYDKCRRFAQDVVKSKFPHANIEFNGSEATIKRPFDPNRTPETENAETQTLNRTSDQ